MNTHGRPSLGQKGGNSAKPFPKISLACGALLTQRLSDNESLTLTVLAGHAWITNEGDPEDYVLGTGETFEIAGPAMLLVEGIHDGAEFELEVRHSADMILAS